MMAPILEELRIEYEGQFDVVFIDVWEHQAAIDQYGTLIVATPVDTVNFVYSPYKTQKLNFEELAT